MIEIIELITRQKVESERVNIVADEDGNPEDVDMDTIHLQDAKMHDAIFIKYGVELKELQAITHTYS